MSSGSDFSGALQNIFGSDSFDSSSSEEYQAFYSPVLALKADASYKQWELPSVMDKILVDHVLPWLNPQVAALSTCCKVTRYTDACRVHPSEALKAKQAYASTFKREPSHFIDCQISDALQFYVPTNKRVSRLSVPALQTIDRNIPLEIGHYVVELLEQSKLETAPLITTSVYTSKGFHYEGIAGKSHWTVRLQDTLQEAWISIDGCKEEHRKFHNRIPTFISRQARSAARETYIQSLKGTVSGFGPKIEMKTEKSKRLENGYEVHMVLEGSVECCFSCDLLGDNAEVNL
jgi:hypothetical protein